MASLAVRISEKAKKILYDLSEKEGESMQAVLEKAIERYRRQRFLEEVNSAYATLKKSSGWPEFESELAAWESTLQDGLGIEDGEQVRKGSRSRPKKKK